MARTTEERILYRGGSRRARLDRVCCLAGAIWCRDRLRPGMGEGQAKIDAKEIGATG